MSLAEHFDLVILDWAGTMVDFGCQAPVKALIEAFRQEGVAVDVVVARRDMGKSKGDHVRAMLSYPVVADAWRARHGRGPDERDVEALMVRLGPLMREQAAAAATLIPGAREMFEQLRARGIKVASSTGYTTYDATVGVSKDNWTVEAFGQNLSNSDASVFTSSAQFIKSEVPLRPRVLGLKLGFKF